MVDLLYSLDMIKERKLVEVKRKDLIAGYIGQTAIKTGEAIAMLIKAMEDHKDDFIVIFAGYKAEMSEFVDSNPGIAFATAIWQW